MGTSLQYNAVAPVLKQRMNIFAAFHDATALPSSAYLCSFSRCHRVANHQDTLSISRWALPQEGLRQYKPLCYAYRFKLET